MTRTLEEAELLPVTQEDHDLHSRLLGLPEENKAKRRRGEDITSSLQLIAAHRITTLSTPLDREAIIRECAAVAAKFGNEYRDKFKAKGGTLVQQACCYLAENIAANILAKLEQGE